VVGVAFRDTTPDALAFVRTHHLTYPSLRDVDGKLAQAYGTVALPESFLLDREGRIVALSRGQIGAPFVSQAIALAERS
jgi:cytochrome c biogenesis protein CcmG/thiol:disulfide interchange protein DsbE